MASSWPPSNVDGVAADAQARAGNQTLIDGVAHGGIGRSGAFRTHVALGGEAGHQVVAAASTARMVRWGTDSFDGLQVFGAGMEKEVDVRVDQAGQQRAVAQVDGFSARRMRDRGAGFHDAIAADQHLAGSDDACRFRRRSGARRGARWVWLFVRPARPQRERIREQVRSIGRYRITSRRRRFRRANQKPGDRKNRA